MLIFINHIKLRIIVYVGDIIGALGWMNSPKNGISKEGCETKSTYKKSNFYMLTKMKI